MKFLFYLQNASKDTIIQLQNVSLGKKNVKMFISEMSWDLSEQKEIQQQRILKKNIVEEKESLFQYIYI